MKDVPDHAVPITRDAKLLDLALRAGGSLLSWGGITSLSPAGSRSGANSPSESGTGRFCWIEDVVGPFTWRARVNYRKRELYFTKGFRPVDGWVMQQLVKLAAPDFTGAELLLNLDSDVFFVRPFREQDFGDEGRVRLLRKTPSLADFQRVWHTRARALFGLPPLDDGLQPDYVGSLIAWRRDVVLELRQQSWRQQERRAAGWM